MDVKDSQTATQGLELPTLPTCLDHTTSTQVRLQANLERGFPSTYTHPCAYFHKRKISWEPTRGTAGEHGWERTCILPMA